MTKKKVPGSADKKATKKALPNVAPDAATLTETTANAIADNTAINKEGNHAGITTLAAPLTINQNAAPSTLSFVGPTTASLKEKFSAQKIPLQTDFANLIDVADCGRNAVGLNPVQPGGTGAGMRLDASERLAVALEAHKGLAVSPAGVAVVAGTGITIDETGVNINSTQLMVAGMIMMFSGTVAPPGWAFCDGAAGRPDLRNRFVLGGITSESNSSGGNAITGSATSKVYNVPTTSVSAGTVTVSVNSHTLTTNQIPSHNHSGGILISNNHGAWSGVYYSLDGCMVSEGSTKVLDIDRTFISNSVNNAKLAITSTVGGGQGHTHTAAPFTLAAHQHAITALPAYYILAYIIKI